jgi:hypothetical protein
MLGNPLHCTASEEPGEEQRNTQVRNMRKVAGRGKTKDIVYTVVKAGAPAAAVGGAAA